MDLIENLRYNKENWIPIIGALLGLISSLHFFWINGLNSGTLTIVGILAFVGAILGFVAMYIRSKDRSISGVLFVVASIFIVLHASVVGIIGAVLLLITGVITLFKKK